MKGRILGLDYGSKTVGVAVSDPLGITAQGVETIRRERETKLRRTLARIDELIREYNVEKIVLGMPLRMDGSPGERAQKTQEFGEALKARTKLPVELWDERLTTVAADRALEEGGVSAAGRKQVVDTVAAVFILESYMQAHR